MNNLNNGRLDAGTSPPKLLKMGLMVTVFLRGSPAAWGVGPGMAPPYRVRSYFLPQTPAVTAWPSAASVTKTAVQFSVAFSGFRTICKRRNGSAADRARFEVA